jgi:hypothetical protein
MNLIIDSVFADVELEQYLLAKNMRKACLLIVSFLCQFMAIAQQEVPSIPQWKSERIKGRLHFTPLVNNGFAYDVMPIANPGNAETASWLEKLALAQLAEDGYQVNTGSQPKHQQVQSIEALTIVAKDQQGKFWAINYMAYVQSEGHVRAARVIYPAGPTPDQQAVAIKHFLALRSQEQDKSTTATPVDRNAGGGRPARPPKPTTPVTAAGQGLKASQIKGVVMHQETGIGVGGMVIIEFNPYLLLADGSIYEDPTVSPYDLDVPKSKQSEAIKWGTWKLNGKTMTVSFPNRTKYKSETWDDKEWFWSVPAKHNERIEGKFKTVGGGGNTAMGGNAMIVISNNIQFNTQGQFSMAGVSGGSNSEAGVSVSTYANKNSAGAYMLDGYSIELKFNNGETRRQLFYFFPDSHDAFNIGNSSYTPVRK